MSFSSNFRRGNSKSISKKEAENKSVPLFSLLSNTKKELNQSEEIKNENPAKKPRISSHLGHIDWEDSEYRAQEFQVWTPLWEESARPKTLDDVKGQEIAKKQLIEWIDAPIKNAVLLSADSSCGKTSLARTLFTSRGYAIWDESQLGVDDNLADALDLLMSRGPLLGTPKRAILIECAEGILGDEKTKLVRALKTVKIPIIITCDNAYDPHMKSFKEHCKLIQLKRLDDATSRSILITAAHKCGKPLSTDSADILLEASHGNVRQALNSMQFMILTKRRQKRSDQSALQESDKSWDLFASSAKVCSGIADFGAEDIASSDLDLALTMLQHNVVGSSNSLESAAQALDSLSASDMLMKSYYTEMAGTIGIRAVAKACKGPQRCQRMQFPSFFGKMSSMRSRELSLRTAGALYSPTNGPTLSFTDKEKGTWKCTPLFPNTLLQQVLPKALDSHELIMVYTAKILKSGLKPKGLKDAKLLTESESANAILRGGIWN
jgi:replication factor C large subunit